MDGLRVQFKNPGRSTSTLRSPNVHRSTESTVSLRGWLYRLEGAALKQWKRRWCVLADYCLFYYKDMAEEKMLGSLLLPSYKISPCFSSDGISRKFAFKAEHNNMKTYYFAADNKEIQQQWMNALSLASIMQLNIICPIESTNKTKNSADQSVCSEQSFIPKYQANTSSAKIETTQLTANKVLKEFTEDESGFIAYHAKRSEDQCSSAILYGNEYYRNNFQHGIPANLCNSVGLPSVYPEQMLALKDYLAAAPPKPQRQYYDSMLAYDLPTQQPIPAATAIGYKLAEHNLINHSSTPYYVPQYGPSYFTEDHHSFATHYPEVLTGNEYAHDYPSRYSMHRLPPRPHSADFLEREQNEDFDEECQKAFDKKDNAYLSPHTAADSLPNILPSRPKSSIARYAPPMFKSQYHQNEIVMKPNQTSLYQNSTSTEEALSLNYHKDEQVPPQYYLYSDNGLPSDSYSASVKKGHFVKEKQQSRLLTDYVHNDIFGSSLARNSQLPIQQQCISTLEPHTETENNLFRGPVSSSGGGGGSSKILSTSDSTGKETSYTSDDEISKRMPQVNSLPPPPQRSQCELTEISREEYYKASQMFFQRQRSVTAKTSVYNHNNNKNSNNDLSSDSNTVFKHTENNKESNSRVNDWNEIGLPMPSITSSSQSAQISAHINSKHQQQQSSPIKDGFSHENSFEEKKHPMTNGNGHHQLNRDKLECEMTATQVTTNPVGEQEVKFKIGLNVRTYKKPQSSAASPPKNDCSKMITSQKIINRSQGKSSIAIDSSTKVNGVKDKDTNETFLTKNQTKTSSTPPVEKKKDSPSSSAPYYYSDLLNEEQRLALQKKLGNFASPPPLLSRCTSANNPRYLGMTSLTSRGKLFSNTTEKLSIENEKVNNNNCQTTKDKSLILDSTNIKEKEDNKKNELQELCQHIVDKEPGKNLDLFERNIDLVKQSSTQQTDGSSHTQCHIEAIQSHIYENYESPTRTTASAHTAHPQFSSNHSAITGESKKNSPPTNGNLNLNSVVNTGEATTTVVVDDTVNGNYFCDSDSCTSIDSNSEFVMKKSKKKTKKRKSKEELNLSDTEVQRHIERRQKERSFKHYRRRCVSAAEYLGKSQEELILMLIQLRQKQSKLSESCEQIRVQMENEAQMMQLEPHRQDEYVTRFDELQQKLTGVEREYELQLPIIETISNMIKVKSKCKRTKLNKHKAASTSLLDQVENISTIPNKQQTLQCSPARPQMNLLHLDVSKISQSESSELVETPNEASIEHLKHQQKMLANELDRVRGLLTHSTKKLEEKAVENAQMEQEMHVARNKLKQVLETEQEAMEITRSSKLEKELAHINQVIDDLHNRRKELNNAIENLKNAQTMAKVNNNKQHYMHHSPLKTTTITPTEAEAAITNLEQMPEYIDTEYMFISEPDFDEIRSLKTSNFLHNRQVNESELNLTVPLYENIHSSILKAEDKEDDEEEEQEQDRYTLRGGGGSGSGGTHRAMFDHVNNNFNQEENDEFFTLNIDFDETRNLFPNYGKKQQSHSSLLEINNNNSQHNLNTMCEFDPTKDLPCGDSIVDQQIKHIYSYQPTTVTHHHHSQKSNEIKTVREVKRESERRKCNQQQNQANKQSQLYWTDRAATTIAANVGVDHDGGGGGGSSYYMTNHFYHQSNHLNNFFGGGGGGGGGGNSFLSHDAEDIDDLHTIHNSNSLLTASVDGTQTKLSTSSELNDELNQNNFSTPDIVQSTIKYTDDFYNHDV